MANNDYGTVKMPDGRVYRYTAQYDEFARCWYGEVMDEDYNSFGQTGYADTYQDAIKLAYEWIAQHPAN